MLAGRSIGKRFGAVVALDGVSFDARSGDVTALLGENGAGKSTLLSIVAGLAQPDAGSVTIDGRPLGPRDVAMVPQEPTFAMTMTVAENVTLGREPTRLGLVDAESARATTSAALARIGAEIDPRRELSSLAPAERQLVAIARALAAGSPKVVILDEPTSSLTRTESERVLAAARALAASGAVVLYVSHHLGEVCEVADQLVVLRAGKLVHAGPCEGRSPDELAELLVGGRTSRASMSARTPGEVLLRVEGLAATAPLRSASFEIRRGEILGVAGLVASGRTELVRAVMGLDAVRQGTVRVASVDVTRADVRARLDRGLGMVSEDRASEGLLSSLSIQDNVTITKLPTDRAGLFVSSTEQRSVARALIDRLGIRAPDPSAPASALSGGNQQKVALARLLHQDVDVFLLDEPTRGIDPESRESLYAILDGLVAAGKAVLWISSQLDELARVADRIAFIRRGVVDGAEPASAHDEASLLARVGAA